MISATQNRATTGKLRALAVPLAALLASLMLAASPAHAETTFTVNSTEDHADAILGLDGCFTGYTVDGAGGQKVPECTLRAALNEANYTPGADTINFAIPGSDVKTIAPGSALPTITEAVTINGYTQPGASANTKAVGSDAVLKIELNGTGVPDGDGLRINASNSTVKGLVINRFGFSGIGIRDFAAAGNKIEGNFIGTDPSGTQDLGNDDNGVVIGFSSSSTVGGTTPAARNLISGNTDSGVNIADSGNQVRGNLIGTQSDGTTALGNGGPGVQIYGASNTVSGNTIAHNAGDGVAVFIDANRNRVLSNSIYGNVEEGIDLRLSFLDNGQTANDPGDTDAGPNGLQNKPLLSSARKSASGTTVRGTLNSTPGKTFQLQFFSNPEGTDEGNTLLGSKSVSTNGTGNASFTFSTTKAIRLGQNITATATNTSTGDTSEFSAPRKVVAQ